MPTVMVRTSADPRIEQYQLISDRDLLRSRGWFVAEGRLVVERLIGDGRYAIRSLLLSAAARTALEPVLAALDPVVPVYVCEPECFRQITGYDIHRGCLAIAVRPTKIDVSEVIRDAQTIVVLEAVTNADNVGGVFRNAAAFGVAGVLLSPTCCDPLYRKAIRTSMAATLTVPFARIADWPDGLALLRSNGLAIVALTPHRRAQPLRALAVDPPRRMALLVGSEGSGLTEHAMTFADYLVRIPIAAAVDSLNLAVAAGIALAALSRDSRLW